jgi:DNA-binding MarR family transcriptional regulator
MSPHRPVLKEMLCFSLYAANNAMNRVYKPLLEPLGLTYPQYLVLVVLWGKNDITVSQIGECLGLDSNTLTPLLKRMEVSDLLKRKRNAKDERQVIISLTVKGWEMQKKSEHIPSCILETTELNVAAAMRLCSTLADLRQSIGKYRALL